MRISYNWLNEYLPLPAGGSNPVSGTPRVAPENNGTVLPEKLSNILTSVGLEVESLDKYEEYTGGFAGLIVGEVIECYKHPDADKLSITKVNTGGAELLQIVCGAPNVASGLKVVVAPVGSTIYPFRGDPILMKKAKIRGIESQGMLCAEDEIGLGENHEGIMILPPLSEVGKPLKEILKLDSDWIFTIGLTPNRMDAMSHVGVARDICAWLSLHDKKPWSVRYPSVNALKIAPQLPPILVEIEDASGCERYSGISISGVTIESSPLWMQKRLKSIGLRPVNNIVDITNFVLHESGQPLHAFDLDKINGKKIIVRTLPENTLFVTLDGKARKLHAEDVMICDGTGTPMCFGGVFGGLNSGVTAETKNIFLESAWFNPSAIRRTSVRHDLRTDAASRFEKGVDISNTVQVLKRAALLIKELCGGEIASEIVDVYPDPKGKKEITLKNHYLKKISGKNYHPDTVKNILQSLGFEVIKDGLDDIRVAAPYSKPDVQLPADIIEEIMRIDGLDNIDIPSAITLSPAIEKLAFEENLKERIANSLTGLGFAEIFTNSITNSNYYSTEVLATSVRIMNSISEDLDIMRPSLLETGLERIEYNLNRKNQDLLFFEFGKSYKTVSGTYTETEHLAIFTTGKMANDGWHQKGVGSDIFFIKGICERLFQLAGFKNYSFIANDNVLLALVKGTTIAEIKTVENEALKRFSIKQPVYFADLDWEIFISTAKENIITFKELSKFPVVHRDLSLVVNKDISYNLVEKATFSANIKKLGEMNLFDLFESEKIGVGKKSLAINFTFYDNEKTLTDKEIDDLMNKLELAYQKELGAEIRKG